jgi:hypothetical protein
MTTEGFIFLCKNWQQITMLSTAMQLGKDAIAPTESTTSPYSLATKDERRKEKLAI